jgi:hypothetical protein
MATKESTRARRRKFVDRPVTPAERISAIQATRKHGGAHLKVPENHLVDRNSPAGTVSNCRDVIAGIARGMPHRPGETLMVRHILDALYHVETILREVGAESDFEREQRDA